MSNREDQARPRRRGPRPGTSDEYRELKHELDRYEEDERRTEDAIEAELRREHFW